jgi:hypothetical protein
MMTQRANRLTAIVITLVVSLAALAGWDIVFDRFVTLPWRL